MVLEKLDSYMQKNQNRLFFHIILKSTKNQLNTWLYNLKQ